MQLHLPSATFSVSCLVLLLFTTFFDAAGQAKIELTQPVLTEAQDNVKLAFKIIGASNRRVRVRLIGDVVGLTSKQLDLEDEAEHVLVVNLFKGSNKITIIGFVNDVPVANLAADIPVSCYTKWCKDPYSLTEDTVATVLGTPRTAAASASASTPATSSPAGANKGPYSINSPKETITVNSGMIDTYLTFEKESKIERLGYSVLNGEQAVFKGETQEVKIKDDKKRDVRIEVRLAKGTNVITFYDVAKPENDEVKKSLIIICEGDRCPPNFVIVQYPSNNQNSRAVVGIEQAGGSSASSETKPFLDFFFTTPFWFHNRKSKCDQKDAEAKETCLRQEREERDLTPRTPRMGFWGQVRLAVTPQQIGAAQVFPSSLVNRVGDPDQTVELARSFDFLAGLEFRVKTSNGNFLSLIPLKRQRSSLYLAGGFGAISPLDARRESAQIFRIPKPGDPQREEFIKRYGEPPPPVGDAAPKEFVGLVPLERDRFLRQWYLGIRLKTHYCETHSCVSYINNFPAIVDFMIGQSEAVTGGSLKYIDPATGERKNAFVFRIDAFYPFPIKEARFLYFYGSAVMKLGSGGVKIETPLFLDTASSDVLINDPRVFIPTTEQLNLRQPNRDYYKIGIGLNLTELFNRNKAPR